MPPVRFLQRCDVLELLVNDLYIPAKQIPPAHRPKYIYLLAVAVSVNSESQLDEIHLKDATTAITNSQAVCKRNAAGAQLQTAIAKVMPIIEQHPVVGMGIICWINANLADDSFFQSVHYGDSVEVYFQLLRKIMQCHRLQWTAVLKLIMTSLEVDPAANSEETTLKTFAVQWRHKLLDLLVYQMRCGCVIPVMKSVKEWAKMADNALTRYFVSEVLYIVEPPYSNEFAASLISILNCAGDIATAFDTQAYPVIKDFLSECAVEHSNSLAKELLLKCL